MPKRTERQTTSFGGDVLRLASGTGIAQIIGILAAPVVTRLFAPDAYGLAALFTSMTAIVGVVACLRYELAIVLPDDDREAANLLWLSLSFTVLVTVLVSVFVLLAGPTILDVLSAGDLARYLWLLPIAVMIHGLFTALNYWNTRTRHFTRLSIAEVTSRLTGTAATLGAGFAGHATGGAMIAAGVGGRAFATAVLGGQIGRDDGKFLIKSFNWREMFAGLKRYRKFPQFSSWAGLLNIASWQLPVFVLGVFFSPAIVGLYALGFRILQMPMSLIGRAIGRVFHQRAARAYLDGELAPLVQDLLKKLILIGLPPMLVLTVIGEELFSLAFGATWAEAGVFAQILGPWAFVWFVSSPLSTLFGVMDRQSDGLKLQILIFTTRLLSIMIGALFGSPKLALALFSATGIFVYGSLIAKILTLAGVPFRGLADSALVKSMLLSIPLLAAVLLTKYLSDSDIALVAISAALVSAYYFSVRNHAFINPNGEFAK